MKFYLALFLALLTTSLQAAPMPHAEQMIKLSAREQPLATFLQDLFGLIDVPVVVADSAKGVVNGQFQGSARSITQQISRAFGVVTYYDGAVMHVQAASDLLTRTLPSTPSMAQQVIQTATDLGMLDNRHTLRATREGALLVSGTPRFVAQIEELSRANTHTSSALTPMGFKVFYLRYAWAQDVTVNFGGRQIMVPGVASTVRSLVTASPRSPAQVVAGETTLRPTQPKLKGQGLAKTVAGQPVLGVASAASETVAAGTPSQPPTALGDAQQIRIEADTRLNAVIVRDAPERLPFYEQLIASLDIEPQSLEIEATIIDVNTDRMRELGINWRAGVGKSSVLFGNGSESDQRLQTGGALVGAAITPTAAGGAVSAVIGDAAQFVARMSAMQSDGAVRVVSSPQVVTLSNVEAIFDNSSTFYVRVAGREEVDLFNVSAGTSLRVTPHVFKDDSGVRIKLLVNLETGRLSQQQTVDAIPVVDRSAINTQALINEGESLLIGGLTQESSAQGVDKVPVLGDIPVLGNLFKVRRDKGARIERMFLISPRLSAHRTPPMGVKPVTLTPPASAPTPTPATPSGPPPLGTPPPPAPSNAEVEKLVKTLETMGQKKYHVNPTH